MFEIDENFYFQNIRQTTLTGRKKQILPMLALIVKFALSPTTILLHSFTVTLNLGMLEGLRSRKRCVKTNVEIPCTATRGRRRKYDRRMTEVITEVRIDVWSAEDTKLESSGL